ncbi:MAG: ribosome maturation factor RimM [Legionellales bacterium]|nr:ribosome maturation factor RimM [Legionellales bacterium]
MNNESEWVKLGRFGRPQGLKGFIRVISFTEPESAILDYLPWHIQKKDQWLPLDVVSFQLQNQKILVNVAGYTDRDDIAELTNCNVGIISAQLPALSGGEYYWHELTHMQVVNKSGAELGRVVQILPTGSNDVLIVQGSKRYLIPYIHEIYIVSVDPVQRQIVVDWDEDF